MNPPRLSPALLIIVFWLSSVPALAQSYSHQGAIIERRLNEAESFFQQNDFEMGANRIVEACTMLRSGSQTTSGKTYVQIASSKCEFLDAKLNASMQKSDYDSARKLMGAEQHLLSSLANWEPQNPSWHYQKAKLFQMESRIPMTGAAAVLASRLRVPGNLHNEVNMQPLQSSIQECDAVLGLSDSSYRAAATRLKTDCQNEIQRRTGNINRFQQDYYRKLPKGPAVPSIQNGVSPSEHYCSKCGGGHESWICPNTHGG